MQLIIQADGNAKCVYDETIDLAVLGRLRITRGSHVEPTADGRWTADLGPCGGPVLGPFALRSEAIKAERQWLFEQVASHVLCAHIAQHVSITARATDAKL